MTAEVLVASSSVYEHSYATRTFVALNTNDRFGTRSNVAAYVIGRYARRNLKSWSWIRTVAKTSSNVFVLYFAKSVELAGLREEQLSLPTPISSAGLWLQLLKRHPRLSVLQGQVVLAVRRQYVDIDDQLLTLGDGDEVAIVPPLSGGEMGQSGKDLFKLKSDWLSVDEVVEAVTSPSCGAISVFIGTTREDELDGRKVVGLEYEAYEQMAQSEFTKLCADIRERWPSVKHICVHHRLGWVEVGQASIVMAISSPHRHDGQQAIQHGINQLKAKIPIWKKEVYNTQDCNWKENAECSWAAHSQKH